MKRKQIEKIAKKAGQILLQLLGRAKVTYKSKQFRDIGSIVTEADIKSEEYIVMQLEKLFPNYNIFSEEKGMIAKGSEYTWYVDPLDGTYNFARKDPLFGVSIGLLKEKEAILGVIYIPKLDLLVSAEKGKGAYANGKPVHVSRRNVKDSLFFGRGIYKGKLQLYTEIINAGVGNVKIIGSSAWELAQIAMGNGEIYFLNSVLHDVVAGVVIVREAGGRVTDRAGNDWTSDAKEILATNSIVHKEILQALRI